MRKISFVKVATCPHCGKKIEIVFSSDMMYNMDFWVKAPSNKSPKNLETKVPAAPEILL